jgi:hypothetical protein
MEEGLGQVSSAGSLEALCPGPRETGLAWSFSHKPHIRLESCPRVLHLPSLEKAMECHFSLLSWEAHSGISWCGALGTPSSIPRAEGSRSLEIWGTPEMGRTCTFLPRAGVWRLGMSGSEERG